MTDIKVAFPAPCSEPWEGMAPPGCHRHCAACDKTIHDLGAMTMEAAEALLAGSEDACVRARIAPDGSIALAQGRSRTGRRLVAAVGASMTLAAAACQTPMAGSVSPRFDVSGQTWSWYHSQRLRLIAANGDAIRPALSKDSRFRFTNLKPGTYTPRYTDICGEVHVGEIVTVTDKDVDVGKFEWEEECIIVGVMVRADKFRG